MSFSYVFFVGDTEAIGKAIENNYDHEALDNPLVVHAYAEFSGGDSDVNYLVEEAFRLAKKPSLTFLSLLDKHLAGDPNLHSAECYAKTLKNEFSRLFASFDDAELKQLDVAWRNRLDEEEKRETNASRPILKRMARKDKWSIFLLIGGPVYIITLYFWKFFGPIAGAVAGGVVIALMTWFFRLMIWRKPRNAPATISYSWINELQDLRGVCRTAETAKIHVVYYCTI